MKTLVNIITALTLAGGIESTAAQVTPPNIILRPTVSYHPEYQPDECIVNVWGVCPQPTSPPHLILTLYSPCRPYIEFSKECNPKFVEFSKEGAKSFVDRFESGISAIGSRMYKEIKLYFMMNGEK